MTKIEMIRKIAQIDAMLSEQRFNRTITEDQYRALVNKRNNLERRLYK